MTSNKVEIKAFGLNSQKNITISPCVVVSGSKSKISEFLAKKSPLIGRRPRGNPAMSDIRTRNSNGPSTLSCGTNEITSFGSDLTP